MSASSFEHPSLRTPVTQEQRDRAEEHLQTAYAEGRITEQEFDRRIEMVLSASTRKDLNEAFYGLVEAPSYSPSSYNQSYGQTGHTSASMQPYGYQRHPATQQGSTGGALAHFSGLFTGILGPGIGYAVSPRNSRARVESAKAFNFQLVSLIALILAGTLGAITDIGLLDFVIGLGFLAWTVLTIVGGVKAASGEDWQNPVTKAVKLRVLPEK